MRIANLGDALNLLVVAAWGAIAGYFVHRFWRLRKPVSLALALMPLGWVMGALGNHPDWEDYRQHVRPAIAIALSGFLFWGIYRAEKEGRGQ